MTPGIGLEPETFIKAYIYIYIEEIKINQGLKKIKLSCYSETSATYFLPLLLLLIFFGKFPTIYQL